MIRSFFCSTYEFNDFHILFSKSEREKMHLNCCNLQFASICISIWLLANLFIITINKNYIFCATFLWKMTQKTLVNSNNFPLKVERGSSAFKFSGRENVWFIWLIKETSVYGDIFCPKFSGFSKVVIFSIVPHFLMIFSWHMD